MAPWIEAFKGPLSLSLIMPISERVESVTLPPEIVKYFY